ncbi:extracellular solute-binding protein [Paenibacillus sp. HB172176]|uniref:extracellular solute-binding protein n=1 Tax=Paenibacillus sp. HB172176 TaxID=2493690 RepID=UPI0014391A3C|nr:extracellular solute-binding protein [Paenibacillus sp. HB172176]
MRKLLNGFSLIQVMIGLMLAAIGCTGLSTPLASPSEQDPDEGSRMKLSIMHLVYKESPVEGSVWDYIENQFHIAYTPIVYPSNSYSKKMRVAVTSGKAPDAVLWTGSQSELYNLARAGMFYDLTEYINHSEHLGQIPKTIWDNAAVDGRLYGIPRPRASVSYAVMLRKDWLKALKLPLPETIDDYYKVAVAFGQQDPDQNGKQDTYGFAAGEGLTFLQELFLAFGAGNTWKITEDHSLLPSKIVPERETALRWMRDLYQERGIDSRFAILQSSQVWDRFVAGNTGIIIAPISDFYQYGQLLRANNPEAELIMLGPPIGPTGISGFSAGPGYYGQVVIPSSVPEDKVEKIIALMDWESSEEGYAVRNQGLEGVHHKIRSDGTMEIDYEALSAEALGSLFVMNPYDPYLYVVKFAPEDIQKQQREMLDFVRDRGIPNPAQTYVSEVGTTIGTIYVNEINNFEREYVQGKRPVDDFAVFRNEWLERGGAQYIEEVNEWYRNRSNNPQ